MTSYFRGRLGSGLAAVVLSVVGGAATSVFGTCGPFADTANDAFCPFVVEIFVLGITTGTTPTTYDAAGVVNRTQMAAFLSRNVDVVLKRGSRRAALGQFWATQANGVMLTTVGVFPIGVRSDGADVWVANHVSGSVTRVRASDGRALEEWTGAGSAVGVLCARGQVLVSGGSSPGALYQIDPRTAAGAVTTVATNLGDLPQRITFDGDRIWVSCNGIGGGSGGSVSIVTPAASPPWTVTTVTVGFQALAGAIYDGANVWVTDETAGTLLKLNSSGAVLQTVTVGPNPMSPAFDGTNIWVPNHDAPSVSVVRASTGAILQTLTGNGLAMPDEAAFDGQRVLIEGNGNTVSIWKAADLSPLGAAAMPGTPLGACSDGVNFWITLAGAGKLARF